MEDIMKVFVAGGDGALGTPLTRLLIPRGHSVLGLIRDPAGVIKVRALGATAARAPRSRRKASRTPMRPPRPADS
jgi:nucleoside-diphosphate-sugar epimerase